MPMCTGDWLDAALTRPRRITKAITAGNYCDTYILMKITWDEPKRLSNLDKHGMDSADLTVEFFETATIFPAKRKRYIALGALETRGAVAVIFAPLGSEAIAVVSMRSASPGERSRT